MAFEALYKSGQVANAFHGRDKDIDWLKAEGVVFQSDFDPSSIVERAYFFKIEAQSINSILDTPNIARAVV